MADPDIYLKKHLGAPQEDVIQVLRDALKEEEGWQYSDLLPLRSKGDKIDWGMPNTLRDTLSGLVDLLEGTRTGEVTGRGALALTGLGAGAGLGVPKNALGIFAGRLAKNAPLEDMLAATKVLEPGVPESTHNKVWNVMGVGNNFKDQGMRWEIDDSKSRYISGAEEPGLFRSTRHPLRNYLDHPELYDNYPWLADIPVRSTGFNVGISGAWDKNNKEFMLSPILHREANNPEFISSYGHPKSVLLHEAQHAIDDAEGFASGSNTEMFLPPKHKEQVSALRDEINKVEMAATIAAKNIAKAYGVDLQRFHLTDEIPRRGLDSRIWSKTPLGMKKLSDEEKFKFIEALAANPAVNAYMNMNSRLHNFQEVEEFARKRYRTTAGEVGARLTEARMDATPEGRRQVPPWTMMDIPLAEQHMIEDNPLFSRRPGDTLVIPENLLLGKASK